MMHITDISGCVSLHNRVRMPYLGVGTYKVPDGEEVVRTVSCALQAGYRHIDTAAFYANEKGVGAALRQSGLKREEVFVTTKIWNPDQGYDTTLAAFGRSLDELGFDYLDLYLVHWPVKGKFQDTWRALESLYRRGLVRAIGISNFLKHHVLDLLQTAEIVPMVNQMEFHPYLVQQDLIDFCTGLGIQYQAWSPLMQGRISEVELLSQLARKYGKDPAQIVLRWSLQKGVATVPKSVTPARILSNVRLFDFELSTEDVKRIDGLDRGKRFGSDPDHFDF
ncbi:MAG: Glyoxal reductase [Syntrophaceae bacterium PtaU1.Bin231]|nr:MAG: Glyoxal reductase [Syntrophaceae bacterium PtaU1.Bin231]HOG17499.1 aldo/keto reductase [Syntrophales bacterium]